MIQWKFLSVCVMTTLLVNISSVVSEEVNQTELDKRRLIAHIAYQLGKEDGRIPKPFLDQPVTTANGVLSASINELTPLSGSKVDASNDQVIKCNAKFEWPNQEVATTDEEIPVIIVLSCKEKQTGRAWNQMGKPLVTVHKGIRSQPELSMGQENTLPPGNYSVTAMLFARLSPDKPPTLLDVKSTEFVVETPNK
jgi:hypothetical protein